MKRKKRIISKPREINIEDDLDDFVGPPPPISGAKKRGRQIQACHWQGNTTATLWVARECNQAQGEWTATGLTAFRRAARLSQAEFKKLTAIGSDPRLARIEPLLPGNIYTLHEISKLDNTAFDDAVKAGVIHPAVQVADVKALRRPIIGKLQPKREAPFDLAKHSDIMAGVRHELTVRDASTCGHPSVEQIISWLQTELHVRTVRWEFVIPIEANRFLCAQIEEVLCWLQVRLGVQITLGRTP